MIKIIIPQFHRTDGIVPVHPENRKEWFDALKKLPHEILVRMGLGVWREKHYLYPGTWYNFIPEGYQVIDINGKEEKFYKGETDNDIRFGCLAYGFIKERGMTPGRKKQIKDLLDIFIAIEEIDNDLLDALDDSLKEIDRLEAELAEANAMPEPGQLICETGCPCCGAKLTVEYGDDEGETAVIGICSIPEPKEV